VEEYTLSKQSVSFITYFTSDCSLSFQLRRPALFSSLQTVFALCLEPKPRKLDTRIVIVIMMKMLSGSGKGEKRDDRNKVLFPSSCLDLGPPSTKSSTVFCRILLLSEIMNMQSEKIEVRYSTFLKFMRLKWNLSSQEWDGRTCIIPCSFAKNTHNIEQSQIDGEWWKKCI